MADLDRKLVARTKELGQMFDVAAKQLAAKGDTRVFFTYSHGYITKRIGTHLALFRNPNSLMRLNDSFATEYLAALSGRAHGGWQKAFAWCKAMDRSMHPANLLEVAVFWPYTKNAFELCARNMAYVHITTDLRNALMRVKDVDAQDYGNILIFVIEGHLYSEVKLRGRSMGTVRFAISVPFMDWLNQNAKLWRNQVFEETYKTKVPEPTREFVAQYRRAEGR